MGQERSIYTIYDKLDADEPSLRTLEVLESAYSSLSDPSIGDYLIFRTLLSGSASSYMEQYLEDLYIPLESVPVGLRALSADAEDLPYASLLTMIMMRAQTTGQIDLSAFFELRQLTHGFCPNFPFSDEPNKERIQYQLGQMKQLNFWFTQYPQEVATWDSLYQVSLALWRSKNISNKQGPIQTSEVHQLYQAIDTSIFAMFRPLGIHQLQKEAFRVDLNLAKATNLLKRKPKRFINQSFKKLLGRSATPREVTVILNFIDAHPDIRTPQILYLSIIGLDDSNDLNP
ncbi:MAG TPA: hypothetical protein DCF84_05660 [Bacteroidetes bacterium]|nr:hypothetical protein [Bacteroidota bacterium]